MRRKTASPALKFCVGGGIWETASRPCPWGRFSPPEVKKKTARDMPNFAALSCVLAAGVAIFAFPAHVLAAQEEAITIATLLKGAGRLPAIPAR